MRRDQLEHAIRSACQIIDRREVIVVGSQAILGSIPETALPKEATTSTEVDIMPIADDNEETARLADLIEGVAGEFSSFESLHGFTTRGALIPGRAAGPAAGRRRTRVRVAKEVRSGRAPERSFWPRGARRGRCATPRGPCGARARWW